ncbi:lovastatin nonaketide synthase [Penicillium freii]|nr:lovastatin nonaketide synthase [Penicillium freii]
MLVLHTESCTSISLIEANDDITLAFNDLPDVKIVRLEGATGSYDSIAQKVCLAWVVDKVRLGGAEYALDLVRIRWDAEAAEVCSHHAHMLGYNPRGLVRGPHARVDLLTTPANERERNVHVWRRSNEPRDSREVVHHRAITALGPDKLDAELRERKTVCLVCILIHRHADRLRAWRYGRSREDGVHIRIGDELPDMLLHEREQTLRRGLRLVARRECKRLVREHFPRVQAVWLARGDHLVLVEWAASKVRAEEVVELGPLVDDGFFHGVAARAPDILIERVLAVRIGDLAPLDTHAVLVDLGPYLYGRLDGLHAVHELFRHTLVSKRLCARSEVVVVEDLLADGRFHKVVERVCRRIGALRHIGVGNHAEEGMLVRPCAEFLVHGFDLRNLGAARPDEPMRVQAVVCMADSCAMEHLKEETGADGRLEEDEDVVVEVAGQGRLDLVDLLRLALSDQTKAQRGICIVYIVVVVHERIQEARVSKALSADVLGREDRGLAALDSDDLLQPPGIFHAGDHRAATGQGSDVVGSQRAQGKHREELEGLGVAGEGNDVRDGFVDALLSGIHDGTFRWESEMKRTYQEPRAEVEEGFFGLPLVCAWPVRDPRLKDGEVSIKDNSHDSAVNSIFVRVRFGEGSTVVARKLYREFVEGPNDEGMFECGIFVTASIDDFTGRAEGGGESRFPGSVVSMENDSIGRLRHGGR